MPDSPTPSVQIRPGFALAIFGSAAVLFALALTFEAELPFARLCLFAWFLSSGFLSIRGFFSKPPDAFAAMNQQYVDYAVIFLLLIGFAASVLEGAGPGAGLFLLAFLWMPASDKWDARLREFFGRLEVDSEGRMSRHGGALFDIVVAAAIVWLIIDVFFGQG